MRTRTFVLRFVILLLTSFLFAGLALAQQELVNDVNIHGNRRIPAETIRARMFVRAGDVYDQQAIERSFSSLWNTGYFDDLRFEREQSPKGWIIHVYVKEKPTIREIKYTGLNSVSQSDVLDRFKERKVGLTQESQYDPTKVKRAEVVLKELLAEHGRQFATIRTEIRQLPPASVSVSFLVKEGPKVKVGNIKFEGNKNLSSRYLRSSMKNLKPIGIPKSIFLENLFSKTYDASKLNEDTERVRDAYQQKGYFKALVQDPQTKIRDVGGINWFFPFKPKHGKAVDITVPVEEGDKYRLKEIKFSGNKEITNNAALRRLIPMKDGEIFNVEFMRKGLKNLRDAYSENGFINFTPVPNTEIDDEHKLITVNFDLDEGKKFFVRRIEFKGNTTTRDKVIRREVALEEGNVYNSRLWNISLLRLNQLGYFEPLKTADEGGTDTEIRTDNQNNTVDLTLKVKEKGKNSIGLSGGVSGLSGSFIGLTYETNNFLGLGETLTIQASVGDLQRNILFGFTEPYLFDRPLQFGFTVFNRKYDFNYARNYEIATGQQITNLLDQSVLNALQNFSQTSTGFTTSLSYPLRRSFKRIGVTYSFDVSSINVFSEGSRQYFEQLNFRNVSGPDSLKGVVTSSILPSLTFNTIDNPQRPHSGKSLYLGGSVAGLGGNVADVRPIVEWKQFIPMKGLKPKLGQNAYEGKQALGYRIQASFISGYGGHVAPPFERFYLGGDTDIRGFDIRSISPLAYFVERIDTGLTNPDDPCILSPLTTACSGVPKDPNNPRRGSYTIPIPVRRLIFPGGDTSIVGNVEYRIPIVGPVTLAPFMDIGMVMALRNSQLQINEDQLNVLNSSTFGCPTLDTNFNCVGGFVPTTPYKRDLQIVPGTNYQPRMSTGLELQVIMPIVNAPFRIYYAWNAMRLNTSTTVPSDITRDMFPAGGAGDVSYKQALANFAPTYILREPSHTFRFTVSTTF